MGRKDAWISVENTSEVMHKFLSKMASGRISNNLSICGISLAWDLCALDIWEELQKLKNFTDDFVSFMIQL